MFHVISWTRSLKMSYFIGEWMNDYCWQLGRISHTARLAIAQVPRLSRGPQKGKRVRKERKEKEREREEKGRKQRERERKKRERSGLIEIECTMCSHGTWTPCRGYLRWGPVCSCLLWGLKWTTVEGPGMVKLYMIGPDHPLEWGHVWSEF